MTYYCTPLDNLVSNIRAIQLGNMQIGIMKLLDKTKPSEVRTMYRELSLLVCALQGPEFDPGVLCVNK